MRLRGFEPQKIELPWSDVGFGLALSMVLLWMATFPYMWSTGKAILVVGSAALGVVLAWWAKNSSGGSRLALPLLISALVGVGLPTATASNSAVAFESALVVLVCLVLFATVALAPVRHVTIVAAALATGVILGARVIIDGMSFVGDWYRTMDSVAPGLSLWDKLPVALPRLGYGAMPHNHTAMVVATILPLTLSFKVKRGLIRALLVLVFALFVGVILLTGSRGGFVAAALGIASALTIRSLYFGQGGTKGARRLVLFVVLVAVMVGVLLLTTGIRPDYLFRDTLTDRVEVMNAGLEMFRDTPLTGQGPGGFVALVDRYLGPSEPGFRARVVWNNAHNGYIQALAEFGIVGFILTVGGVFTLVWLLVTRLRRHPEGPLLAAVIGSLVAIGVQSLIEVPYNGFSPLCFLAVVTALCCRLLSKAHAPRVSYVLSSAVAFVVATLVALSVPGQAEYETGSDKAFAGQWDQALRDFEVAAERGSSPLYARSIIKARSELGLDVSAELKHDASMTPSSSTARLNQLIEKSSATELLGVAGAELLHEEVFMTQVASLLDSRSQPREADKLYVEILRINPWLANSPYWFDVSGGLARRDALIEIVASDFPCEVAGDLILLGLWPDDVGMPSECGASMSQLTADVWQGRMSEQQMSTLLGRSSDDRELRRLAGVLAYRSGDRDTAVKRWTVAGLLGDPWSSLQVACLEGESNEVARGLMTKNFRGFSPVVHGLSSEAFYVYDHSRSRLVYRRRPPPTTLMDDRWTSVASGLHEAMLAALEIESANPSAPRFDWTTMCLENLPPVGQ